ncbi:MAG: hypothetical protein WDW36_001923 [Sanguina aurantia]
MSVFWETPKLGPEAPASRSGHTFTTVGERFLLFGGCGRKDGKAQAFNDLWELDASDPDEYRWKELVVSGTLPPARGRHAAIQLDDKHLLIYGGLDKRLRFSDVWVYSCESRAWTQPAVEGAIPDPRAHFTATKFGTQVIIFGGYGGSGQVLNELWVLHINSGAGSVRWENLTETLQGTGPSPRFDHAAFIYPITPNSATYDKLLIMGGRDLNTMYQDAHMLDLNNWAWENETQPPSLPYDICNNVCDGIESVPYHKVFSFGGKRGMMQYSNSVEVMDCGSQVWSTPHVEHGSPPVGREDTAWVFDVKTCSLLIFGGWANRWLGDTLKLNVSPIIGPPYACIGVSPQEGPVFGSSALTIKGLRFREGKVQVKFGTNEKNEVTMDASFIDHDTIRVLTPNYESYGALTVDVKVSINGEGWTVNKIRYHYFANTTARNCIAYGPGLLPTGGVFGVEMPFLVQARDTLNGKRSSGGDKFTVKVVSEDGRCEGQARVKDLANGQYEVRYSAPTPGPYLVHVSANDLGTDGFTSIRGSPFPVTLSDPWVKHRLVGATPAKRKGAVLLSLGTDLVLYGGDKSGLSVCATDGPEWKWSAPAVEGQAPPDRTAHSATLVGDELVVFGGVKLADQSELNDMYHLRKGAGGGWEWAGPKISVPYARHPAAAAPSPPPTGPAADGDSAAMDPDGPVDVAAAVDPETLLRPILPRGMHSAVAVDRDLYIFGGDNVGDLLLDYAVVDTLHATEARWLEPILKGDIPVPRKGAAAASEGSLIVMFGGTGIGEKEGDYIVLDELVVFEVSGPNDLVCTVYSPALGNASSPCPAGRHGATLQELSHGKLFLYGGMSQEGKPMNDAWVLDVATRSWEVAFNGHSDAVLPTGSIGTLWRGKLVVLNAGTGSPKLDIAQSLDFFAVRESFDFVPRMRVEAEHQMHALEAWIEAQAHGMELASPMPAGQRNATAMMVSEGRRSGWHWHSAGSFAGLAHTQRPTGLGRERKLVDPVVMSLGEVIADLVMVKDVWDCALLCELQFQAWRATLWNDIRTEVMEDGAKQFVKEVKLLNKKVRDEDVFRGVDSNVKNFLVSIPLVADLRSPAMRDRHWGQLMATTAKAFDVKDPRFKLDDLLQLELHKFEEEVGEIVDRAQKEEKMEQALKKLDETWVRVEFGFIRFKDTAVHTTKMADEDFEALEDNQVQVQGMMANRYMATFKDEILSWNRQLMNVADVNQVLSEIQRTWAYLESLFIHSEEVKKELPEATLRFASIDREVKQVLTGFMATRNAVRCCNKEGLMKHLERQQSELEICEKALADYMESKRRAFPRFYFVSTADLLDILSNGNSPVKVMQHMSKCFQAIERLKLDTETPEAGKRPKGLGMESCVGTEYVQFSTPLPLLNKVEDYMNDIIRKMREELRLICKASVEDYSRKSRDQWLFDWSSQMILVVNQIFWCQEVEQAFADIKGGVRDAMSVYNQFQVKQLTKLIEVTRTEIPRQERQKIMNMITIDAHSRDMVLQIAESGMEAVDCFQWVSQLRYYWDASISDCRIRICDASFPYGYEYLGNGARLVITPLTDRIYITATQACWLSVGTAPAGPAGTGKTETTKDLSAQLGKSIYVFNCAPEMDYRTMGDIFKGLAASGSWGCFDEFNRLVPEVLSVCSVQYKCVTDAQKRKTLLPGRGLEYIDKQGVKHPAVEKWTFVAADGVEMPLEEGTSGFITMNPGYIGRAELPESLKALFRPITVMVPDRQLIMENMLMAEGFVEAKVLAKKFASLYYLLEDLLSPQKHYDWGLRAIKSVLVVAGSLLRAESGQVESDVLFRALRDFNIPKILAEDMVIFMGLLNDLFPGVDPPRKRDIEFEKVIVATALEMGLFPEDDFILRIVQLSELLAIRHCVFLMGPTGSGRTEAYRVLAKSITKGCASPVNDYLKMTNRKKVVIRDINPKSISTQELYGYVNMATREWKDGLLSYSMRELANLPDDNPKWILLDGDLDANWIESMNSVMDDNRLLTLPSNERIRLLAHMKLIFEIRDLKFATPATATRAGILYVSEGLQWNNMVQSWIKRVVAPYAERAKWKDPQQPQAWLRGMFERYIPPTIFEMKRSFSHITPLATMNFLTTLVNILEGCLKPENLSNKADAGMFEMYFVFALVWAFGGALCEKDGINYRRNFDKWFKNTWTSVKIPGKGTVYDYFVNPKTQKFQPWAELVTDIDYDSSKPMSTVFVPTAETSSLRFFLDMMVDLRKPIMFVGGAGVGKTQLVKGKLGVLPEEIISLAISFNYFTDVISFQKVLESALEKKAGVNYGPPGTKALIYFVDDLNMPKLDPFETAMPISLIRQHLGWGHWFDRAKLTQKNINNTQYVACMNPTAGSFIINPRLQRLFMTLAMDFPGQDSLMKIYGTFLQGHLKNFKEEVQDLNTKILQAALALHDKVSTTFRKTAINFHYEFTVRHLANVFQGLLMSTPEAFNSPTKWGKLWLHESERVYADRLVSLVDLETYNKAATSIAKKYFAVGDIDDYYKKKDAKPLIFCHFAKGLAEKSYDEVPDYASLYKTLMEALNEYNETNAVMDLVLFEDAMKHVARISRILSNPSGHALLVGVGGSGKQSLSRLAGHICGYATVMIVISGSYSLNNFKEDIQKMYRRTGVKGEGVMFLFTDSQIIDERMLVFVNDLLSSGEIPDLFPQEDKDEIINALRGETKSMGLLDTSENCWALFLMKVKSNLHMVYTASPVGENFRIRSQRFLATVTSTVIDWFQPWPESSLFSVAKKFLDEVDLGEDNIRNAVVEFMPYSFSLVNKISKKFFDSERRYNYTTPKTFLELIKLYKNVLSKKRKTTQENIDRLENGLAKLQKVQGDVDVLVEAAKEMAVQVELKVASANVFAEQVGIEKEKVNAENEAAKVEADKCAAIAREVMEKQASCERDLSAAEPLLLQAEAALDTLNKKDLGEAKSLKKPPRRWGAAQKLMNNVDKFLDRLKTFKAVIDEGRLLKKTVEATRVYLELPHFNRDIIWNKSRAAAGLCDWAINIVKYFDVVSEVEPKRAELAAANATLEGANEKLAEVQVKVAELNAMVQNLEDQFKAATDEKEAAIQQSERCRRKLELANRLITALASEGERWALTVQQLGKDYEVLTGDMLLAAAFVSYAGPFTSKFRASLIEECIKFLRERNTPMTEGISDPLKVLVDDAMVASWTREGLPSDPTSIQNGTILTNSERWPLMMDPQLQGVVWIKERESKNSLQVVRMGADNTVAVMERAIEAGHSVLIENMGESIDAVLSPVITRSTFKKGRNLYVKLGDKEVEYNKNFKLFLHTKLSNPHYPPEIQAETTLINFTVTEQGLEDQLLALVVNKERPDLEETKTQLIIQNTEFTIKLKQLEDELLYKLSTAEGDITEDVALIESLEDAKRVSSEINEKVKEARETEVAINENRNKYRNVAARGSMLFFLLNSLNKVHAFYQFSLNAFVLVFSRGLDQAPGGRRKKKMVTMRQLSRRITDSKPLDFGEVMQMARRSSGTGGVRTSGTGERRQTLTSESSAVTLQDTIQEDEEPEDDNPQLSSDDLNKRLQALLDTCTYTVFNYTRRGLFDRDKLIVLTLLTFTILLRSQAIDGSEYEAMCKGMRNPSPPPITDDLSRWMAESQWSALDMLTTLPSYTHLAKDMEKNSEEWNNWCLNEASERATLPGEWGKMSEFRQLLIVRALRPDRITNALQNFCERIMGPAYVNQDAFSAAVVMEESSCSTPIFFILFPGYSPSKEIEVHANKVGKSCANGKLTLISMGQGQEGPAEAVLDRYTKEGGWVFLDNVHLMQGWIPRLERKLEVAAESAHPEFRCFFSAEPINGAPMAKILPESILQTCIKISNEPPSDMKSNMRRAFSAFTQELCDRPSTVVKRAAFRSILFGLCFYHSLLLGRKKFGVGIGTGSGSGLGFCRGYSFNMGDLTTCGDVLFNYLEAYDAIPWDDLRYMFGEVFYGGHITDGMDRRCCTTYLEVLIRPEIMPIGDLNADPSTWLAPPLELAPGFCAPVPSDYASMREYIESCLPAESPVVYGMHTNAELSLLTSLGETLFRTVTEVSGGGGGGTAAGGGGEGAVRSALIGYAERLPDPFNMIEIEARVKDKTPYVVVALQEAGRMNALLVEMKASMDELQLGLDGALNMSEKMEALSRGIATNSVPALWMGCMSTRVQECYTLSAWYADVLKRVEQLAAWTAGEVVTPMSVWLPGMFNPKACLTAVMQTYARANKLPLDVMKFMTEFTTKVSPDSVTEPAPLGLYIHGLVLEGARWDKEEGVLKESKPNDLHPIMPIIQVKPVTSDDYNLEGYYLCPVYTNMQRANVYSPVVSNMTLRTNEPTSKWVLASVALLLQDDLAA